MGKIWYSKKINKGGIEFSGWKWYLLGKKWAGFFTFHMIILEDCWGIFVRKSKVKDFDFFFSIIFSQDVAWESKNACYS